MSGAVLVALLAAAPASLKGQGITTELQAMKRVTQTTEAGVHVESLIPAATVVPGDQIVYELNYGNQGDQPINDVVISLPVPENMTFLPGSANHEGARVTYSVDGGTTFDRLEALTITTADGLERPARAEDVTHIRWTMADTLAPSQIGTVRCIASVN